MSVINFKKAGVKIETEPANADFLSDGIKLDNSHDWSVTLVGSGIIGGPGTYTVQVSNDNSNWFDWDVTTTNVALADSAGNDHLGYAFIRFKYLKGTTTAGTIDAKLGLFNKI